MNWYCITNGSDSNMYVYGLEQEALRMASRWNERFEGPAYEVSAVNCCALRETLDRGEMNQIVFH